MASNTDRLAELKRRAAAAAVAHVRDGMFLGLGTGSTSAYAIEALGAKVRTGELARLVGVATSRRTAELARRNGIVLRDLEEVPRLDLAIDGADEVDPHGDLIKGGGGALLREKAVERRADRLLIIVDHTKLSPKLGTRFPLPVEISRDTWREESEALAPLGCLPTLRGGVEQPFVTESGHFILDCRFARGIDDPRGLAARLEARPAVQAHGLFLDMASEILVAEPAGVRSIRLR